MSETQPGGRKNPLVWEDQTEYVDLDEIEEFASDSPYDVIPSWYQQDDDTGTDWESLVHYGCVRCGDPCINEQGSPYQTVDFCKSCLLIVTMEFRRLLSQVDEPSVLLDDVLMAEPWPGGGDQSPPTDTPTSEFRRSVLRRKKE